MILEKRQPDVMPQRMVASGYSQNTFAVIFRLHGRLPVKRPGLYTVRLTVIFFHDDERRGDGITLGVDELMEV